MRVFRLSAVVLLISSGAASADPMTDLSSCRTQADSLARLQCYDKIVLPHTDQAASPNGTSSASVTVAKADLRHQPKNTEQSIYSPRIELHLSFKNGSKRTAVALGLRLQVKDAFGDVVVNQTGKLDITILANKTVEADSFYFWEDNQFMADDPYSQLVGAVQAKTAVPSVTVERVIYSDGTVEVF